MNKLQLASVGVALIITGTAQAEDSGFYVGAGVGVAHEGFTGFRGNDTAFKALVGYDFNQYLAAEVEYADGGTQKDDLEGVDVAISSEGFIGALLGKWPVTDRFSPFLKLGYAFYDTRATLTDGINSASISSSESDLMFGGGLEFKLGEKLRLRAELEKIKVSDADYRIYTLTATWRF